MKTATLPPIRVEPNSRHEIEGAVRRGIAAIRETQCTGNGVLASEVLARLDARLLAARQALAQRGR